MSFSVTWGSASLLDVVSKWVTMIAAGVAAWSAFWAWLSYRQSVRLKKAEWLLKLYQQYYESDRYREMRWVLDYRPEREISRLYENLNSGEHDLFVDQLWDYLNFFEFVEGLVKLKQITARDRDCLFEYPLARIAEDPIIRKQLVQGFEGLQELFDQQRNTIDKARK